MSNVHVLSPSPPSSTIEEAEVTISRLCSVLNGAVIDNHIDSEGDIYVTDGLDCPLWIEVDPDHKLIGFYTFVAFDDEWTGGDKFGRLLLAVNELNANTIVTQFSARGERVWGHYWMTFDTRLDPRHFVKMLRHFAGAFRSGVHTLTSLLANDPHSA